VKDATLNTFAKQDAVLQPLSIFAISDITIPTFQVLLVMFINMDSISLLKEVRKPNQLDAYKSIFIRKRQKENIEFLN
jgi:hypothetical protein